MIVSLVSEEISVKIALTSLAFSCQIVGYFTITLLQWHSCERLQAAVVGRSVSLHYDS